jgi:hypothetical protein
MNYLENEKEEKEEMDYSDKDIMISTQLAYMKFSDSETCNR